MMQLQEENHLGEDDEQLFSSARAAILASPEAENGHASAPTSDDAAAATGAHWNFRDNRARTLAHVLLFLAAAITLLARWKPKTFDALAGFGAVILVCVGIAYLSRQGKALAAAKKRSDQLIDPGRVVGGHRSFLTSAIVAILIGLIIFPPVEVLWFFATILFHETGHFVAMRVFGYRGLRMAFTYTGAVTHGDKENVPAWQQATVLLMGPLPGLFLGCGLYFLNLPDHVPFLRVGAPWLVALNFLNLMPVAYLDGDKLVGLLLFRRAPAILTKVVIPSIFCAIYLGCDPSWHAVVLVVLCFAMFVPDAYKLAESVNRFSSRWKDLSPRMKDMTEAQWRDLFQVARRRFSKAPLGWGFLLKTIYEYATVLPAPRKVATAFGGVYLLAITLAVICASKTQLRNDAGRWPIMPTAKIANLNSNGKI
jgi:hypothetical protein